VQPKSTFDVLLLDLIHRRLRLLSLDRPQPRPQQCKCELCFDATRHGPLVHGAGFLPDATKAKHRLLKLDEDFGCAARVRLRHAQLELVIAAPTAIGAQDRAAFAVKEARGPGQQRMIERLGYFRWEDRLSH